MQPLFSYLFDFNFSPGACRGTDINLGKSCTKQGFGNWTTFGLTFSFNSEGNPAEKIPEPGCSWQKLGYFISRCEGTWILVAMAYFVEAADYIGKNGI